MPLSYKLDTDKKPRFVEFYRQTYGHISNTCQAVGISRQTFYDWLSNDEEFFKEIEEANAELNDEIRGALIHKAAVGDTASIIFWLKKRHPEFKDQPASPPPNMTQNNYYFSDEQLSRVLED